MASPNYLSSTSTNAGARFSTSWIPSTIMTLLLQIILSSLRSIHSTMLYGTSTLSTNQRKRELIRRLRCTDMNPRSVDLWYCFCSWLIYEYKPAPEIVRRIFDKAVEGVGYDFNSHVIWDLYIDYEIGKSIDRTDKLFWGVLKNPINKLEDYVMKYKTFITAIPDPDALNLAIHNFKNYKLETSTLTPASAKPALIQLYERENKGMSQYITSRIPYEELIKKSEFDGNALDNNERDAWFAYINYERTVEISSTERLRFTYERALITLSYHSDLWFKYFEYLETEVRDMDYLKNFIHRYLKFFVNLDVEIAFYLADHEELRGDLDASRKVYELLEERKSDCAEVYIRRIQFENRAKNFEGISGLYEKAIRESKEIPP
eukprot:TRINITY_DN6441_c0_g1_i1.p1 TRINITY_DN6441_c0_g1~~TRINITY_DN6441_c0_g1_i1.p1  ORF type:complete len:376 (+),score=51.20 TRINITY_DN6441_c0_g1_i1:122-1249(+)